jgi:6-phosphogluconolactonase
MPRRVDVSVKLYAEPTDVARSAAALFASVAADAVKARGVARLAISGGSTPKAMLALLANPAEPFLASIPWDRIQLFWVDERCVGPEDPDSNFGMTKKAMLDGVPLPSANVHRMEGELEPELGASRYEAEIRNTFKLEGAETPTFDLVLLGMGPDGHTASLFPHTDALNEMARICVANHVQQKDTYRVTLTWPVINQGRQVAFLIEGAGKAEVLKTVFEGPYDPETYPSQLIRPASGKLTLLLDEAAAANLTLTPETDATGSRTATMELA